VSTFRRAQRGFALVIVLWVLAGLTVVAVAVASSVRTSSEGIKLLRDRVRAEAAFLGTSARVKVIAATAGTSRNAYHSPRGLLFADARALRAGEDEWVQVQDIRGLVQLQRINEARATRLLRGCGAGEIETPKLLDALQDYTDKDTVKRINGAEAFEYAATDLPPPRNAPLLSRDELWRVKGWRELKPLWASADCDALISVRGDGSFNRNTAPLAALLADGMDATAASSLMAAREDGFVDTKLNTVTPGDSSNPFNFAGGGSVGSILRVRHSAGWVEWTSEYELELTPTRNGGPWRVHEIRSTPRQPRVESPRRDLPPVNFWDPARDAELNNAASGLPFAN